MVLEICKPRRMFLVAVCQQVKVSAKMSQIEIRVSQTHLIKIEHFEVLLHQDVLVMKILMDGNMSAKVKFGCPLDQIICDMISCFFLLWIFFRNQIGPLAYVINFILNLEFLFEWEMMGVQLCQPFPASSMARNTSSPSNARCAMYSPSNLPSAGIKTSIDRLGITPNGSGTPKSAAS